MKIIKTEQRTFGDRSVSVHNLQTDEQGHIALTQLSPSMAKQARGNIVMMPGMFSNRRFWLSDKGKGLGAFLADQGYQCWMLDRRGQGASGPSAPDDHSLYHTFQIDLPAVQSFLTAQGASSAFYMGHSFGGVLNSISLAKGHLDTHAVSGIINFSSQLTVGKTLLNKPYSAAIYALTALMGFFPAKKLGMGPENESKEAMRDCCRLVEWAKGANKADFWQGFSDIQCPVLGIGSEGDTVDPLPGCRELINNMGSQDTTFISLGKQHGHVCNYDHVGMVISKDAQNEVWPLLKSWLADRTRPL